ncbi:hypothetical protein B4U37_19985 [Sutcliffiella horikoshii]|uniref:Uncharacterized protein n=1 Tax=Sutcliffiella horikoshii TaxID=79883 RepID=A0ABN4ZJ14_9BACI|nr:hypothetical protein [Sutcliffiella horikoshii]ART78181.1 hypothetical protein B4U37_19985 [Sutcliffiella horikoshii]
MIRKIEHTLRPYLYAFIGFTGLYIVTHQALEEFLVIKLFFYFLLAVISVPFGKSMHKYVNIIFGRINWEEQCEIKEYRILKRMMQGVGVVILYFYLQLGIFFVFLPGLLSFTVYGGIPLFIPLMLANLYPIVLLHKRYIWKEFKKNDMGV